MKKRQWYGLAVIVLCGAGLYPVANQALTNYRQEQTRQKVAEQARQAKEADDAVLKQGHAAVSDNFYYQQLSRKEQADYIRLVDSLRRFDTKSPFTVTNQDSLRRVYEAVTQDFPEFYWLSESPEVNFSQLVYPEGVEETYRHIQDLADEVIAQMPDGSDYDKVKYLYEYIIHQTQYHTAALSDEALIWKDQSVRSVFLDKQSVCAGYSRAFQLLCQKAGIRSLYVAGDIVAYDQPHAWNLVRIDGQYYPVDTTWGDPTFETTVIGQADVNTINYSYLCTPKAIFEKTHTAWTGFSSADGGELNYPTLSDTSLNYYALNGAYFTSYNHAELAAFLSEKSQDHTVTEIGFQMGDQAAYDAAFAALSSQYSPAHDALIHLPNYQGYEFYGDSNTYQLTIKILR